MAVRALRAASHLSERPFAILFAPHLPKAPALAIIHSMKLPVILLVVGLSSASTLAQYSARTLTRKVAPQQQPAAAAPSGGALTVRPAAPVDPAKVKAQQSKKEKDLLEYHKKRAEAGSANAQFEMAMRHLAGNGVEKDEKLARGWLEKAAKGGSLPAKKKIEELDAAAKKAEALSIKK